MPKYKCEKCEMEIAAPACAKCQCDLEHKTIDTEQGKVAVCECPSCSGKIKSPCCCGQDMTCSPKREG